jgi:response regulator RpfG family c-di-GMP phosphodiesterase
VPPKILYVDDEESNLVIFRKSFASQFDVFTASSGEAALQILEKEQLTVVLSDQRMPKMTGVELLQRAIQLQPEAITIIVSAYTSFDDATRAINEGQVVRYLRKPWQRTEMLEAILEAVALFERRRENRLLSESLIQEQQTAALGQLTSGLIHELANITAVLGTIEDIREDWDSEQDLTQELAALK